MKEYIYRNLCDQRSSAKAMVIHLEHQLSLPPINRLDGSEKWEEDATAELKDFRKLVADLEESLNWLIEINVGTQSQ